MSKKGQGNTLGIAIIVAIVLVGIAVIVATRVHLPQLSRAEPLKSAIPQVAVRQDLQNKTLQEQIEFMDPTLLFLPTPLNSSDPALPAKLRQEPGAVFRPFPPQYAFEVYDVKKLTLPEPIALPNNALEAIHSGDKPYPYFTFGRINYPYSLLRPRLAYLEVVQARSGQTVIATPLQAQSGDKIPSPDWAPLEMMVAVEASGLVGMPTVTSGSGIAEVDGFFLNLIVHQYRLGSRLPPGFYTLRIGP